MFENPAQPKIAKGRHTWTRVLFSVGLTPLPINRVFTLTLRTNWLNPCSTCMSSIKQGLYSCHIIEISSWICIQFVTRHHRVINAVINLRKMYRIYSMLNITNKQIYRQTTLISNWIWYTIYYDKIHSFVLDLMMTSVFIIRVTLSLGSCLL